MEQQQYVVGDHERTILKFRETVKNMQVRGLMCLSCSIQCRWYTCFCHPLL
jgi:hypothetical protein